MPKYIIEDDFIMAESTEGIEYKGLTPASQLRFIKGEFRDVSEYTRFYIDEDGRKHAIKKEDWQEVFCTIDDELEFKNGQWHVANPLILAQEKALLEISQMTDNYHQQINGVSIQKQARYEAKYQAALSYKARKASKAQKALLKTEAVERGLSVRKHNKAIITAHNAALEKLAFIEAFSAKAKKAINAANSQEEIKNLMQQLSYEIENYFENKPAEPAQKLYTKNPKTPTKVKFLPFSRKI